METLPPLAPFDNISAIARIRMRRPVSGGGASKRFTDKETPALASANTDGKCSCEAGVGKGKAAENEIIILKGVRNQAAMQHIAPAEQTQVHANSWKKTKWSMSRAQLVHKSQTQPKTPSRND
jgi:hypothetical protein